MYLRFIVAHDEYMGAAPDIFQSSAETLQELLEHLGWDPIPEEWTEAEIVKAFDEINGDGQPYYLVYDLKTNKKVLG